MLRWSNINVLNHDLNRDQRRVGFDSLDLYGFAIFSWRVSKNVRSDLICLFPRNLKNLQRVLFVLNVSYSTFSRCYSVEYKVEIFLMILHKNYEKSRNRIVTKFVNYFYYV